MVLTIQHSHAFLHALAVLDEHRLASVERLDTLKDDSVTVCLLAVVLVLLLEAVKLFLGVLHLGLL